MPGVVHTSAFCLATLGKRVLLLCSLFWAGSYFLLNFNNLLNSINLPSVFFKFSLICQPLFIHAACLFCNS